MMLFCTQVKYEWDFFPSQWRGEINNANCHTAWSINVYRRMFTSKMISARVMNGFTALVQCSSLFEQLSVQITWRKREK